jgi:hypothetical protein
MPLFIEQPKTNKSILSARKYTKYGHYQKIKQRKFHGLWLFWTGLTIWNATTLVLAAHLLILKAMRHVE